MKAINVPLIIRGEIIEDFEVEFGGRSSGFHFRTPDVKKHLGRLLNNDPLTLKDLYSISLEEIIAFLDEVRKKLDLDTNPYWREAFEASCLASNLSRSVLEAVYRSSPDLLEPNFVRQFVDARLGAEYLEGWVPTKLLDGRVLNVRAMGARAAHVIAGNVPAVAVNTLLRNAVTRSDMIVKVPSNDLLTMGALARTMIDIDPHHPLTKHVSVAYWKGGDETIESEIYQPAHIEKIVAWGGFASIKHITRYLQPGLDLITLDPKSSTTLIGREALVDEPTMRDVARRVAVDLGGFDQEGCVCARVMFLESGTDSAGITKANQFGEYLYEELQNLPKTISAGPVHFDAILKSEIESILQLTDFYKVYCDKTNIPKSGAVIVSQMDEQVDFNKLLYGRVGNLVPIDDIEVALDTFTAATQTVGIYPDELRLKLREDCALRGAQLMVPVGYALNMSVCGPVDGIEPERRMCRWIVDSHFDPSVTPGPWMHEAEVTKILTEQGVANAERRMAWA